MSVETFVGPWRLRNFVSFPMKNGDFPMKNGDFPSFFRCLPIGYDDL